MTEYRMELTGTPGRGRVVFEVTNNGRENHDMALMGLPEDFPSIEDQLQGETRRLLRTIVAKTNTFRPEKVDVLAVDLVPGRYAVICFAQSPDGIAHSNKGMATEFRVE